MWGINEKFLRKKPFLPSNMHGHTAVVTPISRLLLTKQIQKLKYTVESLKRSLTYRYIFFDKTNVYV